MTPHSPASPELSTDRQSLDEALFATLPDEPADPPPEYGPAIYHALELEDPPPQEEPERAVRDADNEDELTDLAPGQDELCTVSVIAPEDEDVSAENPEDTGRETVPVAPHLDIEDPEMLNYTFEEPPSPPHVACVLDANEGLELTAGQLVTIGRQHLRVAGPAPHLIELIILSPVEHGTLLREAVALTGGDLFTQEDINRGKIRYRHDGGPAMADGFTFATPEGEVEPAAFSFTIRPVHHAPELLGPGRLDGVLQGCRIADILDGSVRCHEPDTPAGMAIVSLGGRGDWSYSLDGMQTWLELAEAHHGQALLLRDSDALRFIPRHGWSGAIKLTYRAWDGSSGRAGDVVNLAPRDAVGGSTAFSRATASALLPLAPQLPETPSTGPWEGTPTLAELFGAGVAVVRLEGAGTWQFSLDDGRTWQPFAPVYHGRTRLLRATDRVRFLPDRAATGKVMIGGRTWDGRRGTAGGAAALAGRSSYGEGTPFGEFVQTRTWWLTGE